MWSRTSQQMAAVSVAFFNSSGFQLTYTWLSISFPHAICYGSTYALRKREIPQQMEQI
jgi:hypothetical protein